jgi:hypothetical protein
MIDFKDSTITMYATVYLQNCAIDATERYAIVQKDKKFVTYQLKGGNYD